MLKHFKVIHHHAKKAHKWYFDLPHLKKFIPFVVIALCLVLGTNLATRAAGDSICVNIVVNECAANSGVSGSDAVEWTDGSSTNNTNFGSFVTDLIAGGNTEVAITSVSTDNGVLPRAGSKFAKFTKSGPYPHRAELSDVSFNHPTIDPVSGQRFNYWYGWSIYIPNSPEWSNNTDWHQLIGQWRYSNISGCYATQTPDGKYIGGSGAEIEVSDGRFLITSIPSSLDGPQRGQNNKEHDLGPVIKGQWVDLIMQAKWSPYNDGIQKVWMNTNTTTPNYQLVLDNVNTANWIDNYNTIASCPTSGQVVPAPNWQVGIYFGTEALPLNTPRTFYADELREYSTTVNGDVGTEVWNKVIR
jgi:Polysaccharide lyase